MTSSNNSSIEKGSDSGWNWFKRLISSETFLYLVKRLGQALLTLLIASVLSFAIIQLAPGTYLDTLRQNPKITPERIEEYKQQFGLDKSATVQYFLWLSRVITKGDFGTSFVYLQPVSSLLWERVRATLELAIASLIVT